MWQKLLQLGTRIRSPREGEVVEMEMIPWTRVDAAARPGVTLNTGANYFVCKLNGKKKRISRYISPNASVGSSSMAPHDIKYFENRHYSALSTM